MLLGGQTRATLLIVPLKGAAAIKDGLLPAGMEWLAFILAGLSVVLLIVNVYLVLCRAFHLRRAPLARAIPRPHWTQSGWAFWSTTAAGGRVKAVDQRGHHAGRHRPLGFQPGSHNNDGLRHTGLGRTALCKNSFVADLNIGILYVFAVTGVNTLAMFMAGLASGNRYAMFGGMRAVAQLISYEIPVVLSVVGIILMSGTMSLVGIVEAQKVPFLIVQPLAFFIFLAGTSAEMNRSPFDQVEAEGEIIAGYHTEYSGMKFGMFQAAEFGALLITSALLATLFLKGWEGPFLPSHLWFLLKVGLFAFIFVWFRATLPRLRVDQIMAFAWKFLLPLSLLNIFVVAVEVLVFGEEVVVDGVTSRVLTAGICGSWVGSIWWWRYWE